MNVQNLLDENEIYMSADCQEISYSGRIDFSNSQVPIFIFPGSYAHIYFTGSKVGIIIKNNHDYHNNYLGYIIDGVQKKVIISNSEEIQKVILSDNLENSKKHNVIIFKRQDICHEFAFYGFILSKGSILNMPNKKHKRRMEFYGDFITCGDMSEADCNVSKADSDYDGIYSNVWYSYAMIAARLLNAEVNVIAQNEITLMDDTGCRYGIENIYDKLHYNLNLGKVSDWNFENYKPHVVVVAIGQNDFMKTDPDGEKSVVWKNHYKQFVLNLKKKYPNALIVLSTSVLNHHPSWDRYIGNVCADIHDAKIVHFLYSLNGRGGVTIRKPQAEGMAFELSMFLKGFGNSIWHG